jgi:hypothetical protein
MAFSLLVMGRERNKNIILFDSLLKFLNDLKIKSSMLATNKMALATH